MNQETNFNDVKVDKKIFFPGQERGEKINLFFRRHPLSFFNFIFIGAAMIILPIVVFFIFITNGFLILEGELDLKIVIALGSAYLLFILGMMLIAWMNYYLDVYIVTDRRLIDIHQESLFSRSISAVDLVDVEDVNVKVQGFLPTYFNFGNVFIQTAGEIQNVNFNQVPQPYLLGRKIMDYHEEAVREERKEAINRSVLTSDSNQPSQVLSESATEEKTQIEEKKPKQKQQTKRSKRLSIYQDKGEEPNFQEQEKKKRFNRQDLKKGGKIDL